MASIPYVIEKENGGERSYDIFSRLLKERIIILGEEVNPTTATLITSQMLYLESLDPEAPIYFYINSPGGHVTAGLSIYDTMNYIKCPVYTIGMGLAASMGSFLLSSGEKGHRYALPNTEIMIHQPSGGAQGQETDILITARNIEKTRARLENILAKNTGKSVEQINHDCERDNYMTAEEALEYGLIDEIMYNH